jgi:hypothetical protein
LIKYSLEACIVVIFIHILNAQVFEQRPASFEIISTTTYVSGQDHERDAFSFKDLYALPAQPLHIIQYTSHLFRFREPEMLGVRPHAAVLFPNNAATRSFTADAVFNQRLYQHNGFTDRKPRRHKRSFFSSYTEWSRLYSLKSGQNRTRNKPY